VVRTKEIERDREYKTEQHAVIRVGILTIWGEIITFVIAEVTNMCGGMIE
jgi:hypothetical protein